MPKLNQTAFAQSPTRSTTEKDASMNLEDLSPEMREEVRKCKTPEEILSLAKKVGRKLSEDELEAISGGRRQVGDDGMPEM